MTGNFCPEDPETRIAEGLRACGHVERVSGQSSYLSALSSMLLLDESQQFPGRIQVGGGVYFALFVYFLFCVVGFFYVWFVCFSSSPFLPPLPAFSVPSCFPVTDCSFFQPCSFLPPGAPYSLASKVQEEPRLSCEVLVLICCLSGRDGNS